MITSKPVRRGSLVAIALLGLCLFLFFRWMPDSEATSPLAKNLRKSSLAQPSQVYLVNFWATWCQPCKDEIPALVKLAHQHPKLSLKLLQMDAATEASHAWLQSVKADAFQLHKTDQNFEGFFQTIEIKANHDFVVFCRFTLRLPAVSVACCRDNNKQRRSQTTEFMADFLLLHRWL